MKTLLVFALSLIGLSMFGQAPPILRTRFTTNADVFLNAGNNVTIVTNNGSNFTISVVSGAFNSTNTVLWSDSSTAPFNTLFTNAGASGAGLRIHESGEGTAGGYIQWYNGDYPNFFQALGQTNHWRLIDYISGPFFGYMRNSNVLMLGKSDSIVVFGSNNNLAIPIVVPRGNPKVSITDYLNLTNDLFRIVKHDTNVFGVGSNGYLKVTLPGLGEVVAIDSSGLLFKTNITGGSFSLVTNANQFGASTTLTIKDAARTTNLISQGRLEQQGLDSSSYISIGSDAYRLYVSGDDNLRIEGINNTFDVGGSFGTGNGTIRVWDSANTAYRQAITGADGGITVGGAIGVDYQAILHNFSSGDLLGANNSWRITNSNGGFTAGTNNFRVNALGAAVGSTYTATAGGINKLGDTYIQGEGRIGNLIVTNGITSLSSNLMLVFQPTLPASPGSYTNTLGKNITVYVGAGVVTAVSMNGTALATGLTLTGVSTFLLQPNEYITITYTGGAPTLSVKPR